MHSLAQIGSRIRFLWLMAAMFVLAIAYSSKILLVYIAFLAFLSLKAYLSITPTRRADRRVLLWAYLSIPIQFALIGLGWYWSFLFFTPIYIFIILPIRMVIAGEMRGFLRAWNTLSWGMLSTVFSLGSLADLLILPMSQATPAGGFGLFLYLMILIQLNYAIQLYLGMRFGYPRLSFTIGATRTWASLAGSLLVIMPTAWLAAPLLTPFSTLESIFIGSLVAVGGFVGYMVLSIIRGGPQPKDRGTMTRGRGVLNRIDAIVYTAPLYLFFVSYLYH
jgi:phosphatidate cytidylyltransferase